MCHNIWSFLVPHLFFYQCLGEVLCDHGLSQITSYIFLLLLNILGPVVQSIVSLMSSLRAISLTVLVDSIYNILVFFAKKM